MLRKIGRYKLGCPPQDASSKNEVFFWGVDFLLKNYIYIYINPGGDWNPGQDNPSYKELTPPRYLRVIFFKFQLLGMVN